MKALRETTTRRGKSIAATICFLALALVTVGVFVGVVGSVVKRELLTEPSAEPLLSEAVAASEPPIETDAPADPASLILVPQEESPSVSPDPLATPQKTPQRTPAPQKTPAVTLCPVVTPRTFTKQNMDVLLVMLDANGHADWIVAAAIRKTVCRAVSIPRNALAAGGAPLSDATNARSVLRRLNTVYPVQFAYYVLIEENGLPRLVDAIGGVVLGGQSMDGAAVSAYLARLDAADEMLRIERQQAVLTALFEAVRPFGWLKLLSLKYAVSDSLKSNLTLPQSMELYAALRDIAREGVVFSTLPVDSETKDGKRFYIGDASSINRLIESMYPAE